MKFLLTICCTFMLIACSNNENATGSTSSDTTDSSVSMNATDSAAASAPAANK